jgi:hypothetical protein
MSIQRFPQPKTIEEFQNQPIVTLTFTKSMSFPSKRYEKGEQITGRGIHLGTRPDGVEVCRFILDNDNQTVLNGLSYRGVGLDVEPSSN